MHKITKVQKFSVDMIEYPQALIFTWALGKKQKKLSHAPKMKTRKVLLSLLLLLLPLCSGGKKGKRLEETDSFDVKPSGQIAHQTIKLVREWVDEV